MTEVQPEWQNLRHSFSSKASGRLNFARLFQHD